MIPAEKRQWLVDARHAAGLTQQQVADAVGCAREMISAIECGTKNSRPELAQAIGRLLGFDWTLFYPEKPAEAGVE